jgi:hypothetical protein
MVNITATTSLWIQDMDYDQYRPATTPFDTLLLVPIHVLLQSLWFNSSPVTNDCLSVTNRNKQQQNSIGHCSNYLFVNSGHGLWSIQVRFTIWHTGCWYPYMCFFSHFDSIPCQWQTMSSVTNRNKPEQNSGGHCRNHLFVRTGHVLWSIQTIYTIWHTTGTHRCASPVTLIPFLPSDKPWPLWQIGTNKSKTLVGIVATASL